MRESRRYSLKEQYSTTKERYRRRREQGIRIEPPASWWRQRHLLFTILSLVLVIVVALTVRGLYRFFPRLSQPAQHQESGEVQTDDSLDYETAKQIFSGEIPAATPQSQ